MKRGQRLALFQCTTDKGNGHVALPFVVFCTHKPLTSDGGCGLLANVVMFFTTALAIAPSSVLGTQGALEKNLSCSTNDTDSVFAAADGDKGGKM